MNCGEQPTTEVIRESLSPSQVLAIRREEKAAGNLVNVRRLEPDLVEIEIIHQPKNNVIDISPPQLHRPRADRLVQNQSL